MRTRSLLALLLVLTSAACAAPPDEATAREPLASGLLATVPGATCRDGRRELYAPPASDGARAQVRELWREREYDGALRLLQLATLPHAAWFATGTPDEVRASVRQTVKAAAQQRRVPVLVAYNLPFRDCAQYSGGGAQDSAAYQAWIDGFARGIGGSEALVILEPDGLGIIPYNTRIDGVAEWCQPTVVAADGSRVPAPGASAAERYAQLNHAVNALAAYAPHAAVYLDASNSGWLSPGDAAYRLTRAGIARAHGFFLNVSNYQLTEENVQFGTWISMALAAPAGAPAWAFDGDGNFHFDWLPSQYNPSQGYAVDYSAAYVATVTEGLRGFMGDARAAVPFVIDTGRNGQGRFHAAGYAAAPYHQPDAVLSGLDAGYWCNGHGAGAGLRPTLRTGVALLDGYLWIKVPGESDGACDIAGGARAWDFDAYNPWGLGEAERLRFDPLWGQVDPDAGKWFPAQALQLARNANPCLL